MSFDTVDLMTGNVYQVTWDTGRRCNYDCTYCPPHRHDLTSPHPSLQELVDSTDFLFEYIDTYMSHRHLLKATSISFTGGEPTVNPNFIEFVRYLKNKYNTEYKDRWDCNFALTSNGAFGPKMAESIIEHMDHITVSYHTEASETLKKSIIERILYIDKTRKEWEARGCPEDVPFIPCSISVNVMFHAQYFDECKEVCRILDENGVKYVPRVIGEEEGSRGNLSHQYTDDQLYYMKNYWELKKQEINNPSAKDIRIETNHQTSQANTQKDGQSEAKRAGYTIGRPCCGSREMCLSSRGEERRDTFVDFRNFKGWHCSVNWFFLHLEQQTDSVFHHQTCQARFDQTRGPIGKISEGKQIIADLKQKLAAKEMPTVICPKHTCGCGLCAPKSAYKEDYQKVLYRHVDPDVFENSMDETSKFIPLIPIG